MNKVKNMGEFAKSLGTTRATLYRFFEWLEYQPPVQYSRVVKVKQGRYYNVEPDIEKAWEKYKASHQPGPKPQKNK